MIKNIANSENKFTDVQLNKILTSGQKAQVTWDFDGVVADSEPLQWRSYELLAVKRGVFFPVGCFNRLVGNTEKHIWEQLFKIGFPTENINDLIAERALVYEDLTAKNLTPSWVASALMPFFYKNGIKQYVVSNGKKAVNEFLLNRWGFDGMVSDIFQGNKVEKLETLHGETPGVLIEDNVGYLNIGKNLGCFTIFVTHSYSPEQGSGNINVKI